MIDANSIATVLAALVVVVAVPLTLFVTIRLAALSRQDPRNRVLRQQVIAAAALFLLVVVFSIVFVNNELGVPPLSAPQTKLLTRGSLLILSIVPSLYWLWLYRGSR